MKLKCLVRKLSHDSKIFIDKKTFCYGVWACLAVANPYLFTADVTRSTIRLFDKFYVFFALFTLRRNNLKVKCGVLKGFKRFWSSRMFHTIFSLVQKLFFCFALTLLRKLSLIYQFSLSLSLFLIIFKSSFNVINSLDNSNDFQHAVKWTKWIDKSAWDGEESDHTRQ